tara:strand:- start:344 stop:664 length:321 start_codon:yes stop_codon:yes gene_type:complete
MKIIKEEYFPRYVGFTHEFLQSLPLSITALDVENALCKYHKVSKLPFPAKKHVQAWLQNGKITSDVMFGMVVLVPGKTKQFLYNRIIVGKEEEEEITNDFDFDSTI